MQSLAFLQIGLLLGIALAVLLLLAVYASSTRDALDTGNGEQAEGDRASRKPQYGLLLDAPDRRLAK